MVLDAMAASSSASDALKSVIDAHKHRNYRQVLAVDATGQSIVHSGENALGNWSSAYAENVASGGNLLANTGIPQAIVDAFTSSQGHLGDRLIHAMQAGLAAGGEAGPVHSAGMLLVDKVSWPVADLRCDWTDDCPITAIANLWDIYKPQLADYVKRALDPSEAPSYGVPGDD